MARVADVMGLRVVSVRPEETVEVAIARMLEEDIGSVAVCEGQTLVGIFTERDVLRLAGGGGVIAGVPVAEVMTRRLVTVSPEDDAIAAARLMGERRIRHLPVVEDGNLMGVVGIRDVLGALVERLWREHDPQARETAKGLLARTPTQPSG